MKASIEISMYPLTEDYGTPILAFIERMHTHPDVEIRTNTMSTQLFGDYEVLMDLLKTELKTTFADQPTTVMVLKIVNANLR